MHSYLFDFSRNLFFHRFKLPKPPLAQHILLSIPPNIPNSTRDKLTQLFFENLQAPALYLVESPVLQILACNATSGITIDFGTRSTLVGYVSDSILLEYCCHVYPVGEQDCDDYLMSLLLDNDPALPTRLDLTSDDPPEVLYATLSCLISNLKSDGHVRFEPSLRSLRSSVTHALVEEDDNGITDVAQAIVSGKADKIIGRQVSSTGSASGHSSRRSTQPGRRLHTEVLKESDTILVAVPSGSQRLNNHAPTSPNLDHSQTVPTDFGPIRIPPASASSEGIQISKIRHRHAEPLFSPSLLSSIPPVFTKFGLDDWAKRYRKPSLAEDETLVQSISAGLQKVIDAEQRRDVAENLVLAGAGGAMCRSEGLLAGIANEIRAVTQLVTTEPNNRQDILKPLKVPDYFSEFKSRNDWLEYLGGCIVAKLVFNDASSSKLWMSKPEYSKEGPYISRKIASVDVATT